MILSPTDRDLYFPSVNLEGDRLIGTLRRAQLIAEGEAHRSLELETYTELLPVNRVSQTVQLSYFPIAASPAPSFQGRTGGRVDGFGRYSSVTPFTPIQATDTVIDCETGMLNLTYGTYTAIKATYSAGFDFSIDTSETTALKAAVGGLVSWMESLPGKGVSRYDPAGVQYSSTDIPEHFLAPFRKYRPIGL